MRSPPRPCLPSDETEGNSKFNSSLYFRRAGRRRARCFLLHRLRCAERRGKPKVKGEGTFSPTLASLCPGPDVPQIFCPYISTCSRHPRLQLFPRKSLEQHCPCAAPAQKPWLVGPLLSSHLPPTTLASSKQLRKCKQRQKKARPNLKKTKRGGRGGVLSRNVLLMFKQGTPLGLCLIRLGVRGIYSFVFLFKQKGLPITTARREPTPLDKQA